jgi:2-polyprenyl-3-methyl-5-hydroxy-6-metoxy-1,4-benzoquinol methylase
MNCCTQRGLNQTFTPRVARMEIDDYRRNGLDKNDRLLAQAIIQRGVQGASVLEIGGGIGSIQIELLKAGAVRTMDVDISEGYVAGARELARLLGFADVTEYRVLDFAHEAQSVESADLVVMNRVVCCYPDMPALLKPAAERARKVLALTFPRESWWMRAGQRVMNFGLRVARRDFRVFVHSHRAIIQIARDAGLQPVSDRWRGLWRMIVFERV